MRINNKVEIIVPTKIGFNDIDETTINFWKDYILAKYSRIVGGASVIKQEGAWIDDFNELIKEENYLVYCYVNNEYLDEVIELTKHLASDMRDKLEQDSVMYVVNGEAKFS